MWGATDEELATFPTVYAEALLNGQVAVISGGGSGIGRAAAFLFARLGAEVVICGRTEDKLQRVCDAIERFLDKKITYRSLSTRDPEMVEQFISDVWKEYGKIDCLVNSAGGHFVQPAVDFSVKGWNAVVDTNLNGTWHMMQSTARLWHDHNYAGNIVNIVLNVSRGNPQVAHSSAARAGVIHLSKTVAVEWAPKNIRVNCIAPGPLETEGLDIYRPEVARRLKDACALRRMGHACDIAEGIVYLASSAGKFITGELLTIDGGQQLWGDNWPGGTPEYFQVDYLPENYDEK
jgi:NAD(P)-dependent dehydrogenase (short-subunit alcohol dehydrogenase family)